MAITAYRGDRYSATFFDDPPASYDLFSLGGKTVAVTWVQGEALLARFGNAATGVWGETRTLVSEDALGAVDVTAEGNTLHVDWVREGDGGEGDADRTLHFQSFDRSGAPIGPATDLPVTLPGALNGLRLADGGFAVASAAVEDIDHDDFYFQTVARLQIFDADGTAAGPARELMRETNGHDHEAYERTPGLRQTADGSLEVIMHIAGDDLEWSSATPSFAARYDPVTGETAEPLMLVGQSLNQTGASWDVAALDTGDGRTVYSFSGGRHGSFAEGARFKDGALVSLGQHQSPVELREDRPQTVTDSRMVATDLGPMIVTTTMFSGNSRSAIVATRHDAEGAQIGDALWLRDPDMLGVSDVEAISNGAFVLVTWTETDRAGEVTLHSRVVTADLAPYVDPDRTDPVELFGRAWDDRAYLGGGDDSYSGYSGNDEVFGGPGDDTLDGVWDDDTLHGEAGADLLVGGPGDDLLDGGPGDDEMRGGEGHDTYWVDSAGDVIVEPLNGGLDHVVASIDYVLDDISVETVSLDGDADLRLEGNRDAQALIGNAGDNTLVSGGGADTLTGGDGADIFMFRPAQAAVAVTDFDPSEGDKLALADRFLGLGSNTVNLRPVLREEAQAALRDGDVTYDADSGTLHIRRPGAETAELVATLTPGTVLGLDDVLLF